VGEPVLGGVDAAFLPRSLGNAAVDPRFGELEEQMKGQLSIKVPTVQLHGAQDGAALADAVKDQERSFPNGFRRQIVPESGHFIPRECPEVVVDTERQ
jgi:pimeloyl-ACP methyl ester carboxylesterase